jgi:hypothetical protein
MSGRLFPAGCAGKRACLHQKLELGQSCLLPFSSAQQSNVNGPGAVPPLSMVASIGNKLAARQFLPRCCTPGKAAVDLALPPCILPIPSSRATPSMRQHSRMLPTGRSRLAFGARLTSGNGLLYTKQPLARCAGRQGGAAALICCNPDCPAVHVSVASLPSTRRGHSAAASLSNPDVLSSQCGTSSRSSVDARCFLWDGSGPQLGSALSQEHSAPQQGVAAEHATNHWLGPHQVHLTA